MNIKGRRMIKGNGFGSLGKLVRSGAGKVADRAKKQANDIMDEMPKLNLLAKAEQNSGGFRAVGETYPQRYEKGRDYRKKVIELCSRRELFGRWGSIADRKPFGYGEDPPFPQR
jgi:hypothetical protein